MSRRLRDERQDEMADVIIARNKQRKANAREWIRRMGDADVAGDAGRAGMYSLGDALFRQSLLEWPHGG